MYRSGGGGRTCKQAQVSFGRYSLCNLAREGPCIVHTIGTASLACLFSHGLHSLSNSSLPADPL